MIEVVTSRNALLYRDALGDMFHLRQRNLSNFCGVLTHLAPEAESFRKILQLHGSYRNGKTLKWLEL